MLEWVGHIERRPDGHWGRKVLEDQIEKRSVERLPKKWTDDLGKAAGTP